MGNKVFNTFTVRFCHWSLHPPGEGDRERLVEEDEDDLTSVGTENILMSGLSQTSFVSSSMFSSYCILLYVMT